MKIRFWASQRPEHKRVERLCETCAYAGWDFCTERLWCNHPRMAGIVPPGGRDEAPWCREARSLAGPCGPEAVYFHARDPLGCAWGWPQK